MKKHDLRINIRLALNSLGRNYRTSEVVQALRGGTIDQLKAWLTKLRQEQRDRDGIPLAPTSPLGKPAKAA